MSTQTNLKRPKLTNEEINSLIIESIQDIKGNNILLLDLRHLEESPTDFFVICEGTSNTHVKAISDNIQKELKKQFSILPNHVEGERNALWVCVDYFSTVVHIFFRETREFYDLEELWGDAKFTEFTNL